MSKNKGIALQKLSSDEPLCVWLGDSGSKQEEDGYATKGPLLFVHSSQVYVEELNNDSSSISHRGTTEPPGTEPKPIFIHQASLLFYFLLSLSLFLSSLLQCVFFFVYMFCRIYSNIHFRSCEVVVGGLDVDIEKRPRKQC